jgi:hypothetical protein
VIDLEVDLTVLIEINVNGAIDAKWLDSVITDDNRLCFGGHSCGSRTRGREVSGQPSIEQAGIGRFRLVYLH